MAVHSSRAVIHPRDIDTADRGEVGRTRLAAEKDRVSTGREEQLRHCALQSVGNWRETLAEIQRYRFLCEVTHF